MIKSADLVRLPLINLLLLPYIMLIIVIGWITVNTGNNWYRMFEDIKHLNFDL